MGAPPTARLTNHETNPRNQGGPSRAYGVLQLATPTPLGAADPVSPGLGVPAGRTLSGAHSDGLAGHCESEVGRGGQRAFRRSGPCVRALQVGSDFAR